MHRKDYSEEEARDILKRAVAYQERDTSRYTNDQLLQMGRELGLTQDAIVKAAEDVALGRETPIPQAGYIGRDAAARTLAVEEAIFRRERMRDFYVHASIFAVVSVILLLAYVFGYGAWGQWFWFALVGWVIGIISHYASAVRHTGDEYEKQFDAWLEKREVWLRRRQERV
jgi:hypothetical protein